MILPIDALFRAQREHLALRMYCEDCVLFEDRDGSCAHGYPSEPHRRPVSPELEQTITFCKDFEAV